MAETTYLRRSRRAPALAGLAVLLLAATGCGHHNKKTVQPQALPPAAQPAPQNPGPTPQSAPPSARIPITPVPPGGVSDEDLDFVATHKPILT